MKKFIASILLIFAFFQNGVACATISDKFDVQKSMIPLSSRLKKEFSGYEYVLTNNSKESVNILNAQIINGQDGNMAYQKAEVESGVGVTWAIAGPVGLFTLGIGWVAGLIATPIVIVVQNKKNNKMRNEGMAYSNIVPLGALNAYESVSFKTLVPIGAQPQLKLNIMDSKKNIHTINK